MKTITIIAVFISLMAFNTTKASSFVGGDITYTCLGGHTYKIAFTYYQDCSDSVVPTQQLIYFSCSSHPALDFTAYLTKVANTGQEINLGFSCDSTTCEGGSDFGVKEFIYEGIVTLPNVDSWKITASGCCRNSVTSVAGGMTNTWFVESMLNNAVAPCNSSATFSNIPVVPMPLP